jgi:DNA invertase Pin-like site-specific DNA recombinase
VRQSSLQQVVEHTEGRRRQYDLRQRALALGWRQEQIEVIDSDQGLSGASADREGFQRLVADVGLNRAGVVMGLEVSRLARNSADWHQLLEICALTGTLILDEDGLYDPHGFNDRLLLGLKGTMSEAELHLIRARLQGGLVSKARRGELRTPLPLGFVYDEQDQVVLHPDEQVRETIRLFFRAFRRVGTILGTVKVFRRDGLAFPRQAGQGPSRRREILWGELDFATAWRMLKNPRYAGVYFWGSSRQRRLSGKWTKEAKPREEWVALIPDAHEGYITLDEYEENQRRIAENAQASGADCRRSAAREGPGLLQGVAVCGRCGRRMGVRYHQRKAGLVPTYYCGRKVEGCCQSIAGDGIDEAMGLLVLEVVSPVALEVSLRVQEELERRLDEADRLRQQQLDRARYEAELARQRFLCVDPTNRLVAATLEADWNAKLLALRAAHEELERRRQEDRRKLSSEERARIRDLARDFPRLWSDPRTPARERKRMLRLLVEDVTLLRAEKIEIHVRFRGGATRSLCVPPPKRLSEIRRTEPRIVAEIDRLLDEFPEDEIAEHLNARDWRSASGGAFDRNRVAYVRRVFALQSRADRLRVRGMATMGQIAAKHRVATATVRRWRDLGMLRAHRVGGDLYFYEMPPVSPDEAPMISAHPSPKPLTSERGAL